MSNTRIILIIAASTLAGILLGYWFFGTDSTGSHDHQENAGADVVYTCSMHPQIRRNEHGKCPICGMDLVPAGSLETETAVVSLSESAAELANVQTTVIGKSRPVRELSLNGTISPDETAVRSQTAHADGRIEALFVNTTGESVRRGQRLASLYSPNLILAQKELLQAAGKKDAYPGLYRAAVSKLRSFEITDQQIERIESSGKVNDQIDIHADYSGIVTEKKVNLGDHVTAGDVLFTIADLSRLWVNFEAYEKDLPFIRKGDSITFTVPAFPGTTFSGKVSFIDPVVNPRSRVTLVRVEISNRDNRLKPEMYVKGKLQSAIQETNGGLIVPKSAVLWTGERSVVYVAQPGETYSYSLREVDLGLDIGDAYVIKSGLQAGERVVTKGTFAVDAAAQLSGKPSMMTARTAEQLPESDVLNAFRPVMNSYLQLKDALIRAELSSAKTVLSEMEKQLNTVDRPENSTWEQSLDHMAELSGSMLKAESIDTMRKNFISLSQEVIRWSRGLGSADNPLYIMYCPMADNNNGALWVSDSDNIENPYYGDLMLNCGEVTETINN